jgi:hypothetical protein
MSRVTEANARRFRLGIIAAEIIGLKKMLLYAVTSSISILLLQKVADRTKHGIIYSVSTAKDRRRVMVL